MKSLNYLFLVDGRTVSISTNMMVPYSEYRLQNHTSNIPQKDLGTCLSLSASQSPSQACAKEEKVKPPLRKAALPPCLGGSVFSEEVEVARGLPLQQLYESYHYHNPGAILFTIDP